MHEALIDEAWALLSPASGSRTSAVDRPKAVAKLYAKYKTDDVVSLALARLENRDNECQRAVLEENSDLVAPYVASWLDVPERFAYAAGYLGQLHAKRAIPILQRHLSAAKTDDVTHRCLHALGMICDGEELDAVSRLVNSDLPFPIAAEMIRRGVASLRGIAIARIERWLGGRKNPLERYDRDDAQTAIYAMDVLSEGGAKEATDVIVRVLETTPYVDHAMRALARLADERSRAPARAMLDMLGGDEERNWPYRLGLQAILRALGESFPLETARDVVRWSHPQRYGWPKTDDHAQLLALAATELLDGTPDERAWVAKQAIAPLRVLRLVGVEGWKRIHGSPPALRYFDPELAKRFVKDEKPARVIEAIESPTSVYRHNLVDGLASTKDAKIKKQLVALSRREIESRLNHRVSYYEKSDMGPDAIAFFEVLKKVPKKELEGSSAPWIQHGILEKDPVWPERPIAPTSFEGTVTKLGSRADGAFAVGKQVNALAMSNDGKRLFVGGDSHGMILDSETGATVALLDLKWNWAYDAVFSMDDSLLVVAYHGGHLEIFDAKTGKRETSFKGHGGAPNGIKRVVLTPDGKTLLSCGSDGHAFLWSFPAGKKLKSIGDGDGSFEGAAFSRDGKRFALCHWYKKTNTILLGDTKTGKTTKRIKTKSSMWAALFLEDGTLVTAGDGKHIHFFNASGKEKKKIAQAKVVRLKDDGAGGIYALSQTGELQHWKLENNLRTKLKVDEGALWAIALGPSKDLTRSRVRDPPSGENEDGMVFVAGTSGVIQRFTKSFEKLQSKPLLAHTGQVRGFAFVANGFLTCGWDGKLIRWTNDGTAESVVHTVGERMTEMVTTPGGRHVLVLHGSGLLCFDASTLAITGRYEAKKLQSSLNNVECVGVSEDGTIAAIGEWGGGIRTFRVPTLEPIAQRSTGMKKEVSAIAAYAADGWIAGNDAGLVLGLSRDLEVLWTMPDHGRDLLEGEPMGNPHKTVMSVAVRKDGFFASAATDHTARLFTPERVQKKRWMVASGLFNNAVFSPSGKRLALSSSWYLAVFDTTSGETLAHVPRKSFAGVDELTRTTFVSEDENELLVGAENGNLYRVVLELSPTPRP